MITKPRKSFASYVSMSSTSPHTPNSTYNFPRILRRFLIAASTLILIWNLVCRDLISRRTVVVCSLWGCECRCLSLQKKNNPLSRELDRGQAPLFASSCRRYLASLCAPSIALHAPRTRGYVHLLQSSPSKHTTPQRVTLITARRTFNQNHGVYRAKTRLPTDDKNNQKHPRAQPYQVAVER